MTSRHWLSLAALSISLSGCCHLFGSGESDESEGFNDCEDKDEGEACSLCAPDDEGCVETMEVKVCNADGRCGGGDEACALPEGCPSEHHHH